MQGYCCKKSSLHKKICTFDADFFFLLSRSARKHRRGEGREFIGCYLLIIYFAIRVRVARDLANKAGNG